VGHAAEFFHGQDQIVIGNIDTHASQHQRRIGLSPEGHTEIVQTVLHTRFSHQEKVGERSLQQEKQE
jgi:hypothetical protein